MKHCEKTITVIFALDVATYIQYKYILKSARTLEIVAEMKVGNHMLNIVYCAQIVIWWTITNIILINLMNINFLMNIYVS